MLRVLHVFKTYPPDSFTGIERVIHAIATGCAQYRIASSVLTVSPRGAATVEFDGHEVHTVPLSFNLGSTPIAAALPARLRQLATEQDIIHYHHPWPMADIAHLIARPETPAILTYHSDIVRQRFMGLFYSPLMYRHLRSMKRVIATSPNYRDSSAVLQRLEREVEVVPIGLDAPSAPADPKVLAYWRERCGGPFFLFLGVLRYYKGLDYLVEAARLSGLPVVIAGSGPEEARLKRSSEGLGNVQFIGQVGEADKGALIESATALVLPSHLRSEAYGVVLVEASMRGRPLITAEIGTGTSFVNQDGESGISVPPRDPVAIATAMRRLWEDAVLARRLGDGAKRRHAKLLTGAQMARRYAAIYNAVASV